MSNNVIEVINESIFTVLSGALLYLNEKSRWQDSIKDAYMWLILANSTVITLIVIGML